MVILVMTSCQVMGSRMGERNEFEFLMIGGHPALDLLNTQPMGPDGLREKLLSMRHLARWAQQAGLLPAGAARKLAVNEDDAALEEVRRLREALRLALQRYRDGKASWRGLTAKVNAVLKQAEGVEAVAMSSPGAFQLSFKKPVETPRDLTWLAARQIADFLESGDWRRAFPCEGTGCVLWFVDRTKNRSRHWCRMETCGARAKAKAYYQRKKRAKRASS